MRTPEFQSTCPARGTTFLRRRRAAALQGISIHVPREGHDVAAGFEEGQHQISIHVPREGHDLELTLDPAEVSGISIHVPREGHDP